MLIAQSSGNTTTRSTQDLVASLSQILQLTQGTSRTDYVYGHERLLALEGTAQTWYGSDALGSVRQTLAATGTVSAVFSYDPWGTPQGGATPPVFGFTGELQDGTSGLTYLRARWYQPQHGRFLSRDPFAGFPTLPYSQHPYQYAYADPVLNTDPSGEVAPVCPTGYSKVIKDGQFAGCEEDPDFPEWLWFLKGSTGPLPVGGVATTGTLPLPQAGGQAAGKALEACAAIAVHLLGQLLQVNAHTETQTNNQQRVQLYHYTDEQGFIAISASGVIRANTRNLVFVSPTQFSPEDAFNILFIGNPLYEGKGDYVVQFIPREGTIFIPGTQPAELIHYGSLRNGRNIDIMYIGPNPFK
ncbi:RHS repeat-associated core domain-containing protein [Kallotenue papyrolyticum]|uniref:RHS repeat-associated core domain-containing protein n=1 Tax=Kallotenue papyrolyticum TaxID=1325125 RepID=UPI0004785BFB